MGLAKTYQIGGLVVHPKDPNVVYVGSGDDNIYALDAASGTVRWTYATGNGILSSPLATGGTR